MNLQHPNDPDYAILTTDVLLWLAQVRKPESLAFELRMLRGALKHRHEPRAIGPNGWRVLIRVRIRIARRIKLELGSVVAELERRKVAITKLESRTA